MDYADRDVELRTKMINQRQYQALVFIHRYIDKHGHSPIYDEIRIELGLKAKSGIYRIVEKLIRSGQLRQPNAGGRGLVLAGPNPETELVQITMARDGGFRIWISPAALPEELQVLAQAVSNPWTAAVIPQLDRHIEQLVPILSRIAKSRKVPTGRRRMFSPATDETPASWRLERPWHVEAIRLRDQGMKRLAIAHQLGVTLSALNYFLSDVIRAARRARTEAQWREKRGRSSDPATVPDSHSAPPALEQSRNIGGRHGLLDRGQCADAEEVGHR